MLFRTLFHFAVAGLLILLTPAAASAQRMSDRDGQRFFTRGGPKIESPRIELKNPDVLRIVPEDTYVSLSPEALSERPGPKFLAKTTINVITREPLSEQEIDALAAQVRRQAEYFHVIGVRFRQGEQSSGQYAWFLYWDGSDTVRIVSGAKEQIARSAGAAATSLRLGEQLVGSWSDAGEFPGVFSITVRGGRLWLVTTFTDGSGGDDRIRLRVAKGGLLVGAYTMGEIGTFKSDGSDSDRISVRLVGDELHVSDNSEGRRAWFVGRPSAAINRSIVPKGEPQALPGGFSATSFKTLRDALACVREANARAANSDHQKTRALRRCFSSEDIARLGWLAEAGAEAQTVCGASIKQAFRITPLAEEVIWAALVADEQAHIGARYKYARSSAVRGGAAATELCSDLLRRFGPAGSEVAGLIEKS